MIYIFTCYLFYLKIANTGAVVTDEEYTLMPQIFEIDDYDTCMMMKPTLYCYATLKLSPIDLNNSPKIWHTIQEVSSSDIKYRRDLMRRFICVPKTCPKINISENEIGPELEECFNTKFAPLELKVNTQSVICRTSEPLYKIDNVDRAALWLFIFYIFFTLLLSTYDYIKRCEPDDRYRTFKNTPVGKITTTFSIPSNWSKLRSIPTNDDFEKLKSVQGIRVYMAIVVVMVHTCVVFTASPVINPQWLEKLNESKDFMSNIMKRGIFLLSFHFMASAWMLMNSMLSKHHKKEEIDAKFVVQSIIKRYIRFAPSIGAIVFFYATWYRHIPYGPFWVRVCEEGDRCRQNWWANLLFIQNYYDRYNMCHIVSWYLAVEMHYYVISLLLIKVLLKFRSKITMILTFLLVVTVGFTALYHYSKGYPSTISGKPDEIYGLAFNQQPQWHDHFASWHGNFSGTIMGLIFGYLYYQYKNKQLFTSKLTKLVWGIISFNLIASVFYIPLVLDVDATPLHSALWVALTRLLFSFGTGLLVLGLSHGLGGFVKWTLEWYPLLYLAKLSYSVYIIHTVFQNVRVGIDRTAVYLNLYLFTTMVIADVAMAFLLALPFSLLFEMPAHEIANQLSKSQKPSTKND